MANKVELLAPAGSLEKLKMAVLYGADAVYLGGEEFSLREAADNFTIDEIREGIAFAHNYGAKVYAAINIIAHNEDLEGIELFAQSVYEMGIDAVIVADMGVFSVIREAVPELDIHVSTQANTVNHRSAAMWYKLGAKRVVLARELPLSEMKEIRDKTPLGLELEAFVHGAMCISYSGRCLLSNYMTHRESNRGACAQPCRWKYSLVEEQRPGEVMPVYEGDNGTFIFNSKDLCLIEHLPELIEAGITSLKIEGRMKTAYYAASVVKAYREALDAYYLDPSGYRFNPAWMEELQKVSHRHYYTGFFHGKPEEKGQVYNTSSYIRTYDIVGVVLAYEEETGVAVVQQRNKFGRGDTVEIIQPNIPGFLTHQIDVMLDENGREINTAPHAKMTVRLPLEQRVIPGAIIREKREQE